MAKQDTLPKKTSSPSSKAPRSATATPAEAPPPRPSEKTRSYAACYEAFVAEARALPEGEVRHYRSDARLARYNVCVGVEAVLAHAERVARELPAVPMATLTRLPDLARAVVYATRLAQRKPLSDHELRARSSQIAEPRQELLASARAFARRGVFDPAKVRAIEVGTGRIDQAEDVVELIELFTDPSKRDALRGKHPFTDDDFRTWREAAEALLEGLRPAGTARPSGPLPPHERDLYALWTLLLRDHAVLRRVGYYLFPEDEIDARVPKALSRTSAGAVPAEEGEEDPPPAPQG